MRASAAEATKPMLANADETRTCWSIHKNERLQRKVVI